MLSFWESESFSRYDVAIVGAGITGLSLAIELKKEAPEKAIIILERGLLPTGASTKNAGFACVGSLTEILDDLHSMPTNEVAELVKMRFEGLQMLRNRLGDKAIDYQEDGSYELCLTETDYEIDIQNVNKLLFPIFDKPVFRKGTNSFGFGKQVKSVIESSVEGQIDTGKMMRALMQLAGRMGIEIKTGYEVKSIRQEGEVVALDNDDLPLEAKQVCICANAFAQSFSPDLDIVPGRGQVLITKPILNLPFKGSFHFSEGYYYFRTIGNRVLFGGGRQLDFKGETTTSFDLNESIQNDLEEKLREIILPNTQFEIDQRWTGVMAFGENKKPIISQIDTHIYAAVRMGGMGIAIGSKVAQNVANLMLNQKELKP